MIKINTSLRTIEGPTCYEELTVELFQKIIVLTDPVERLALLYNLDYNELMNSTDQSIVVALEQASSFLQTQALSRELPVTGKIKINDRTVVIPEKLSAYSVGQAIQCRRVLEKAKTYEECISRAAAIYLQPAYTDSPFTMMKVDALEQLILKMPVTEVLGVGFFLLKAVEQLWQSFNERTELIEIPGTGGDAEIAKAAGVERLSPLADLSIIDQFAQTYSLDPDDVYLKSFGTITNMMILWREREGFQKRFNNLKKPLEAK